MGCEPRQGPLNLTARKIEILQGLADGKSPRAIAGELFISKRTVDFHLNELYEHLGTRGQADSVAKAMRYGVIV